MNIYSFDFLIVTIVSTDKLKVNKKNKKLCKISSPSLSTLLKSLSRNSDGLLLIKI